MSSIRIFQILCAAVFALTISAHASPSLCAQEAAEPSGPQVFEMTVSPAAEPVPALKYSLVPAFREKRPGNAATYYMRANLMRSQNRDLEKQSGEKEEQWLKWPLDEASKGQLREWLAKYSVVFEEIENGAYSEQCDWGIRILDLRGLDTINLRLLEVSETRALGRMLRFKARLAIAEGRVDDALESVRQGYQLAVHVAAQPTLINALVGVSIMGMMDDELRLLLQDPNAPNLYWAIAALPRPLIDIRQAMEQERNMANQVFPVLLEAETAEHSPEQWQQLLEKSVEDLVEMSHYNGDLTDKWQREAMLAYTALLYPRAKEELIASGMPVEKVEAMSVAQVLLIQTARATQFAFDEVFKWSYFPYSESHKYIADTQKRLMEMGYFGPSGYQNKSVLPIAALLLPAVEAATFAPIREQRRLSALHTIEALRSYAAANDGRFPETLEQITHLPLPRDPLIDAVMQYHLDGDAAVIELAPRAGHRPEHEGYRYVVRLRK